MSGYFLYILSVGIGGFLLVGWLWWLLKRMEAKRAERIEGISRFDPVKTKPPQKSGAAKARRQALDSLETRFSIIRRTFVGILLLGVVLAMVFPFIGELPTTMVSIFVTATAVVVGIAARPLVENVIAGFVLTFSKQFHTGDTVLVDDAYGIIEDITPTHTIIKLWDWRRYVVPNNAMLVKEVTNYSTRDSFLWARLEFYVAPDSDLDTVREIAVGLARSNRYFAGSDDPQFWVMEMGKEAIKCWLAAWARTPADAWSIRVEVGKALVQELQARGIKTHLYQHEGPAVMPPGPSEGTTA